MKVLYLTHSFPRYIGDSPGNFIYRLARALGELGVEVHVVAPASPGYPEQEVMEGISVHRFRYAPRKFETLAYTGNMAHDVASQWSAKFAMVGLLGAYFTDAVRVRRKVQPDLIHAHWWFPGGLVGSWVSKMAQIPLITTLHGSDVRIARSVSAMRPLARMVLQHSEYVTTVSKWLASDVQTFANHTKTVVAPMPVEVGQFTPSVGRSTDHILLVGRLNAQKGIAYAIRALAQMRVRATLDVIGDGPGLEEYRALADELGVGRQVVFHGHIPHDKIADFYQRAAALVVPSTDEGLGLVAVEAQLCETPVVAFNSGGLPDVVQDGLTGVLVEPRNVSALASALDTLLSDPSVGRALGQAGRMAALAHFAPESVALRYFDLYQQSVQDRAP